MRRVTAECARCRRMRSLSFRRLCRSCEVIAARNGTLIDWEPVRSRRTLADFAEDYLILKGRRYTATQIAEAMGYSTAGRGSLRTMINRARKAGLLPTHANG